MRKIYLPMSKLLKKLSTALRKPIMQNVIQKQSHVACFCPFDMPWDFTHADLVTFIHFVTNFRHWDFSPHFHRNLASIFYHLAGTFSLFYPHFSAISRSFSHWLANLVTFCWFSHFFCWFSRFFADLVTFNYTYLKLYLFPRRQPMLHWT